MENIWTSTMKPIPGLNGYYCDKNANFVSTLKRKEGRKLIPTRHHSGYYLLGLTKDGKVKSYVIHRLMGITHLSNPNNLPIVDHIDRDKSNNKLSNLRWATNLENTLNSSTKKIYKEIEFTQEDINEEVWKISNILDGYGVYDLRVSSLGKLKYKSKTGRYILIVPKNKQGYNTLSFRPEYKSNQRLRMMLHVFIWRVFNGDYDDKIYVINHKNGNKCDCRLSNLELCTFSENTQHAHDNGMVSVYRAMTKEVGESIINDFYNSKISPYQITKKYNKASNDVWALLRGAHEYYEYSDEEIELCKTFKIKQSSIISDTNKKSSTTKIKDEEIFKQIIEYKKDGLSVRDIATKIHGVGHSFVHKYVTNNYQKLKEEHPHLFI